MSHSQASGIPIGLKQHSCDCQIFYYIESAINKNGVSKVKNGFPKINTKSKLLV